MSAKVYPAIEHVRQCLRYEDGKLYWLRRPVEHFPNPGVCKAWNTHYSGKEAGTLRVNEATRDRRWAIVIDNRPYFRSRLVWALHHDEWLIGIDHENRDPIDDRIENLRPATLSQNQWNKSISRTNKSGYKGVSLFKRTGKWVAFICRQGKRKNLGTFDDPESAHRAYMEAAREWFGEFATDGKRDDPRE